MFEHLIESTRIHRLRINIAQRRTEKNHLYFLFFVFTNQINLLGLHPFNLSSLADFSYLRRFDTKVAKLSHGCFSLSSLISLTSGN